MDFLAGKKKKKIRSFLFLHLYDLKKHISGFIFLMTTKRHMGAISNISITGTSPGEPGRAVNTTPLKNHGEKKTTFTRKRKL